MSLLEVDNVSKLFGANHVLDSVSLTLDPGQVHGLVGPNGAGKTTLIRIINRIIEPDGGEVRLMGRPVTDADPALLGYLPEERGLYRRMSVGEQGIYFARLRGLSRTEAEQNLRQTLERLGIGQWYNRRVAELSKGMQQTVQFAIAVAHRPRLIVLDEPFSGFDATGAQKLQDEVLRLASEGAAVLLSSHNLHSVQTLCSSLTMLHHGRVAAQGPLDQLCPEGTTLQQLFAQKTSL
ncbi:MAG: ATP-binding cassette domain-containing protein [Bacteroidales bacterium]|nr:ATP-binding cassette domain-containing protein [Bacteroidales bacterium]